MNEFSHETSGRGIRPRTRRMRHPHSHRHHRFGGCGSGVAQDTRRRDRGERIHAVHELHRALANVTRNGDEQLRGEAAQIVAAAGRQRPLSASPRLPGECG